MIATWWPSRSLVLWVHLAADGGPEPWAIPDVRRQLLNCARWRPSGEIASSGPLSDLVDNTRNTPAIRGRGASPDRLQLPSLDWVATASLTVDPERLVTPLSRGGPCTGGRRRC